MRGVKAAFFADKAPPLVLTMATKEFEIEKERTCQRRELGLENDVI